MNESPIIAIMDGETLVKVIARTPGGDLDIGEALARFLHYCRSGWPSVYHLDRAPERKERTG